jgi:hypothetical protein
MENLTIYKSPFTKTRIGKPHDGGYVIAELQGEYDTFLSGGVSNDISFEKDFLERHPNLQCYAFDGTISKLPEKSNRITFVKKNLGSTNTTEITNLHEYMRDYNNIFMKMDIEGHEFRVIPTFFENGYITKIKQLVLEIHSPADILLHPNYYKTLTDIKNNHMFEMLENINKTHTLIHLHANNGCNMNIIDGIKIPHVFECTFIRNDFMGSDEKIKNDQPLPTEIDMKNIPDKPDYYLAGFPYSV